MYVSVAFCANMHACGGELRSSHLHGGLSKLADLIENCALCCGVLKLAHRDGSFVCQCMEHVACVHGGWSALLEPPNQIDPLVQPSANEVALQSLPTCVYRTHACIGVILRNQEISRGKSLKNTKLIRQGLGNHLWIRMNSCTLPLAQAGSPTSPTGSPLCMVPRGSCA